MHRNFMFLRPHQCLGSSLIDRRVNCEGFGMSSFGKSGYMRVLIMHKTCGGKRPKKKIYYRVHELDRAMDLQKKPSIILQLKSIVQAQKSQSLLLRDLEKEVGFVQKWNFMAVIDKYPTIFHVSGGSRAPPMVMLTEKAKKIAAEEIYTREQMEPIVVRNLRKLLMLSIDCRLPLETVEFIESAMGLPCDFKKSLIPKYPEYFSVKDVNGRAHLQLENWDSGLAVTAREERLVREGILAAIGRSGKVRISKDGNFLGPFAFHLSFPVGFRPNKSYLEEVQRWQKMEFPSPYLNARRFESADPKARKRMVAVLHELLSLTMEKRMTAAQLEAFHSDYRLPARLLLCMIRHHGIFYITNKGAKSTVFLKEGYDGSNLIDKCPLLVFWDKFVALTGRREIDSYIGMPSQILHDSRFVQEESAKKTGDDTKKQLFQRLWSEGDEIVILKGCDWSLAKEEAAKSKAAKDVMKVLTLKRPRFGFWRDHNCLRNMGTIERGFVLDKMINTIPNAFKILAEWKLPVYDNTMGITLVTATTRRNSLNNLDSKIHHHNLLNNIIAKVVGHICYHILAAGLNGYLATVTALNTSSEQVALWCNSNYIHRLLLKGNNLLCLQASGKVSNEYVDGARKFVNMAKTNSGNTDMIICPCGSCRNLSQQHCDICGGILF
ncbi:unnamed protein product [Camellia sinensis]